MQERTVDRRYCGSDSRGGFILLADDNSGNSTWPQWGQNPQHQGFVNAQGQPIQSQLANIVYDPLVPEEQAFTGGELLAHY